MSEITSKEKEVTNSIEVEIDLRRLSRVGTSKFILVKEEMVEGNNRWVIVCKNLEFHRDILLSLLKKDRVVKIHGGGKLSLIGWDKHDSSSAKLISFDKSIDYGAANPEIVGEILSEWCEEKGFMYENRMKNNAYL